MKLYPPKDGTHYFCGAWNGSPIEVALTPVLDTETISAGGEIYHTHPYREYIVLLEGSAAFLVDGERIETQAPTTIMFEAGDAHRVLSCSGARWVLIKERSEPDSKTPVPEPGA